MSLYMDNIFTSVKLVEDLEIRFSAWQARSQGGSRGFGRTVEVLMLVDFAWMAFQYEISSAHLPGCHPLGKLSVERL